MTFACSDGKKSLLGLVFGQYKVTRVLVIVVVVVVIRQIVGKETKMRKPRVKKNQKSLDKWRSVILYYFFYLTCSEFDMVKR